MRTTLTSKHHFSPQQTFLLLWAILMVGFCVRIGFFTGASMTDSLSYAEKAYHTVQGQFSVSSNVHSLRLGLILPTALVYKLCGVNEFSSILYPLLCSLGNILLIFFLSQLLFKDTLTSLVCAGFMAVFPQEVIYATQLMPEIPVSFLMALCVYGFLRGEQTRNRRHARWFYVLSGIAAGLAYMTKIFEVFLALFFLAYLLYVRRSSVIRAYGWIILGFCCIWLPEMGFYAIQTGDPLFRLSSIIGSPGSRIQPNPGEMFRNDLFIYPYYWFISLQHFGLFYYAIAGAFAAALWKRFRSAYIPMLWAGSIFLYLQFGFEGRYVIHKEARFLSIITIPCLLVLGRVFAWWYQSRRHRRIFWSVISVLCVTSLIFIIFHRSLLRSELEHLRTAARYIQQELPERTPVYTDATSGRYMRYFSGYQGPITDYIHHNADTGENTYPVDLKTVQKGYVVVNWHMINSLRYKGITYIHYPEVISDPPPQWKSIHRIQAQHNWVLRSLRLLRDSPLLRYLPSQIAQKIVKTVERMLKSAQEDTIFYRIES